MVRKRGKLSSISSLSLSSLSELANHANVVGRERERKRASKREFLSLSLPFSPPLSLFLLESEIEKEREREIARKKFQIFGIRRNREFMSHYPNAFLQLKLILFMSEGQIVFFIQIKIKFKSKEILWTF